MARTLAHKSCKALLRSCTSPNSGPSQNPHLCQQLDQHCQQLLAGSTCHPHQKGAKPRCILLGQQRMSQDLTPSQSISSEQESQPRWIPTPEPVSQHSCCLRHTESQPTSSPDKNRFDQTSPQCLNHPSTTKWDRSPTQSHLAGRPSCLTQESIPHRAPNKFCTRLCIRPLPQVLERWRHCSKQLLRLGKLQSRRRSQCQVLAVGKRRLGQW